ncbi:MAG: hypothetical protein R3F40_04235 [Candidatus Competibacteraceae bacterium]
MQDGDLVETQPVDGPRRHAALFVVARRGAEEMLEAFSVRRIAVEPLAIWGNLTSS